MPVYLIVIDISLYNKAYYSIIDEKVNKLQNRRIVSLIR
jgi:hypothetical protein